MADLKSEKDVWLNKLRQTKEYQGSEEGRKYLTEFKDVEFDDLETPEEIKEIRNKLNYTIEDQIQEIAAIVAPTMYDVIFNEIIEVMDNYDDLNWGYFVQDDAPTALLDACFDHKTELHYEIFQVVLQKLK